MEQLETKAVVPSIPRNPGKQVLPKRLQFSREPNTHSFELQAPVLIFEMLLWKAASLLSPLPDLWDQLVFY